MSKPEVEELLRKYTNGLCTDTEKALVESWHLEELKKSHRIVSEDEILDATSSIWSCIQHKTEIKPLRNLVTLYAKIAAAAIVCIALTYLLRNKIAKPQREIEQAKAVNLTPIKPGETKATLTLGDGSKITLTDSKLGLVAHQQGIKISKTNQGALVYTVVSANTDKKDVYNTLQTPFGGQFQVVLPDETKVWLNADSKLTYPAVFNQEDRQVSLVGEAYFEVAKKTDKAGKRIPFRVKSILADGRSQLVEVLGTHFNINAYNNEPKIKTTLLEGSVRVANLDGDNASIIKPGQQAVWADATSPILIKNVYAADAVSWKDGFFSFNDEDLQTIMNKISRWYSVDVEYVGPKINKVFGGRISKFNSVNEVLDLLQTTGAVKFKITGRRILVMP
ncbi:transmembrane sensor [Pedobacter sp. UYP30]|uniref:FecR family protein n=1 Tax=Pedobacter sp. UYP30 TaxID=1756400 RepID=UPI00339915AB